MSPVHDYSTGELPASGEEQWDTEGLRRDFDVLAFQAPFVVVRRKSDGVQGSLQFNHHPRVYWGFEADAYREDRRPDITRDDHKVVGS